MILFVSFHTSDLWKPKLEPDDPAQPFICAIAAELTGKEGNHIAGFDTLVKPLYNGKIREGAESYHGISTRTCEQYGMMPVLAMGALCDLASKSKFIIGYSMDYDRGVVESEIIRLQKNPRMWNRPGIEFIDIMKKASFRTKIEPAEKREDGQYKWPSLSDAADILLDYKINVESDLFVKLEIIKELFNYLCRKEDIILE